MLGEKTYSTKGPFFRNPSLVNVFPFLGSLLTQSKGMRPVSLLINKNIVTVITNMFWSIIHDRLFNICICFSRQIPFHLHIRDEEGRLRKVWCLACYNSTSGSATDLGFEPALPGTIDCIYNLCSSAFLSINLVHVFWKISGKKKSLHVFSLFLIPWL